jgi:hypothetical protein
MKPVHPTRRRFGRLAVISWALGLAVLAGDVAAALLIDAAAVWFVLAQAPAPLPLRARHHRRSDAVA